MDPYDRLVECFALVVLATVAGCSDGAEPSPTPASAPAATSPLATPARLQDADTVTRIRTAALAHARAAGVPSPASMHAVAAAHHQAAEAVVSGAVIADHSPVFVVQMTGGRFEALHHPRGVAAPEGAVMTVTFDAATLRVTDVGYDAVAADLTRIDGDVVDLMAR